MSRLIAISEKDDFINELTEHLIKKVNGKDLSNYAVVFQGLRPSIFLRKNLAGKIDGSFIPPEIFSIDRFMEHLFGKMRSEKKVENKMDLIYLLYRAIRNCGINEDSPLLKLAESMDKFILWGERILSTLEEIEVECSVYNEVEIRAEYDERIIDWAQDFWKNITAIIQKFEELLKDKELTFRGEIYRFASENIENISKKFEFKKIVFAGFNALNLSEKRVIKYLIKNNKAEMIIQSDWDGREEPAETSEYYHNYKLIHELKFDYQKPEINSGIEPVINIIQAFDTHSEVIKVKDILNKIENRDENVAIVIPESHSLVPLLGEVVSSFDCEFNITLQYPVRRTSLFSLIEIIFSLQETKKRENRKNKYYICDYLNLLNHPYIKTIKHQESGNLRNVIFELENILINENNNGLLSFFTLDEIEKHYIESAEEHEEIEFNEEGFELLRVIHKKFIEKFNNLETAGKAAEILKECLKYIHENTSINRHPLSNQYMGTILRIIKDIQESMFADIQFESPERLLFFLKNYIQQARIPFKGRPLEGVQIMGMLETRSLNFDNVIVLDVNEGIIPRIEKYNPMLPQNFRRDIGLPDYRLRESIYAYNFFRLINGASNVYLLYKEGKLEETDENIKSRFIERLLWKKEKEGKELQPENLVFSIDGNKPGILLEQNRFVAGRDITSNFKEMVFSSTALDTYITCPLKFYYHYGLNLRKRKEIQEDIEMSTIGLFVHKFLKNYYKQFTDKKINVDVKKFMKKLDGALFRKFTEGGGSIVIREIIKETLGNFIKKEKERVDGDVILLGVERELEADIKVNGRKINLFGRIDRVDKRNDSYYIIDYKTGRPVIPVSNQQPEYAENRESIKKKIASLQLPFYSYIFVKRMRKEGEEINYDDTNPEIIGLGNLNEKYTIKTEYMDIFISAIKFIIGEIINPDIPFSPEPDTGPFGYCGYCPYRMICPAV